MASSEPEGEGGSVTVDTTENPVSCSDEMYGISADMIRKHKELLQDRLQDTEFGILGKLLANDGLTHQETTAIENFSKNPYDRSKKLIDLVLGKNIVSEFIKALEETGQKHLVNYLRGDGAYNAEFGEDWPLGHDRIKQLDVNQEHLIDIIEPCDSGLIGILFSAKVINDRQFRSLSQGKNPIKKNKALLNIMRRQSVKDYNSTIGCLINSNQAHIAKILQETGVVLRIRVSQEGDPQAVNHTEDAISDQFANLLRDHPIEEAQRILEMTQLKIIAANKGKSIYLYVYCASLDELTELHNLLVTGAVKTIVETLFNNLVSRQDPIVVSYTYSEDEYVKCKSYFEEIGSTHSEIAAESEVEATPLEEFQTLSLVQEEPESQAAAEMNAYIQKLRESKGERPVLREDDIIPAIIRNNMDYFTEHIQPRLLINKLHGLGIIRDERMRHLRSMSYDTEKNYEVLNIIRAASIENYHLFVQCLRETDQSLVAEVAEKGGVVLKVKVTHEPTENPEEAQKEIVEKLKKLQDKAIPKSEEVWRFLSQLKRANIEIVSSRLDKGVVMWFWCRSQHALATLEYLNRTEFEEFGKKSSQESTSPKPEFQKFGTMLNGLFNLLLSGKTAPTISSVFLDNPDKDVVCQKLSKDFSQEEDTKIDVGGRRVRSVAKLESKIYVLCQSPTAALVFEEGDLTQPREELPVAHILDPVDMASSNESNCLYITDEGKASVWKIAISSPENKVDQWLDGGASDPFTLSVTNDGRVVMVKRGSPSSLDIYHPDARLLLHLILPTPILTPNHAVETSKGNFVVSYGKGVGAQGGVCEITKEGQIISRIDSMFESINGVTESVNTLLVHITGVKFLGFNHLSIDDKDQVYACCYETDGLVCLDSRLNLETIITKDELKGPLRVHYVKQDNQLMVIDRQHKNLVFILNAK